jgi:hypothetical protein
MNKRVWYIGAVILTWETEVFEEKPLAGTHCRPKIPHPLLFYTPPNALAHLNQPKRLSVVKVTITNIAVKTRGTQKEAPEGGKRNNWMEMRRERIQWASLCRQHSHVIIF